MIKNRNQRIFEMSEKNATLNDISKKFKISQERVRQIITFEPNFCVKHSKYFQKTCPYCDIESVYKDVYFGSTEGELLSQLKGVLKLGRSKQEILRKRIFIRALRDKFKYSFNRIASLLKRDHTSILNLYYNG